MTKKVKIQFVGTAGIQIPLLKDGRRSVTLPFKSHTKGGIMEKVEQILEVDQDAANDLMRAWPKSFIVIKDKPKAKEMPVEEING